jgi:tetratricopeptide (TPR) repeat protein
MISSTAIDLPEHRRHASDACLRMTMLPLAMEQWPASPMEALSLSREYVDQADYYLGIFGFRYGFIPEGQDKSITELEYERAIERRIPRFIFIAQDDHRASLPEEEPGVRAEKLRSLKERLKKDQVVRFFRSVEQLRTEIIHALATYRQEDARRLHYIAEIPPPPEPWVAHWYSLLGGRPLVGRRAELNLLTDWVANPSSEAYAARLFALVAIGGMGKSALAWHWFNEIAPREMKPLAGRIWWSFYESDARFNNFTARALAYLTRRPRAETEKIPLRDREDQLLAIFNSEPHLVVIDGLERELVAYATMDAAHLSDDDLDARTAHQIALRAGLPATAAQSFVGQAKLRQTADPRTGHFLRRLAQLRSARILITTRLFPYELQDFYGDPVPGTFVRFLPGLSDDDALDLWRSAGISGARDSVVPLFRSFEGHPLVVRALAGEIARDRRSPGNFDRWKERHPGFDPFALPLVQRKSHVLAYALQGVSREQLALLRAIAGFRMPAAYETLAALLIGDGNERPFSTDDAFDRALADLDDRGLVGWDRRANRYDLHPIVRGVIWSTGEERDRRALAERMRAHFEAMPAKMLWEGEIESFEELTPTIELFVSLIRLGRYEDAIDLYSERLDANTFYRFGASRQRLELVEMLFPDGIQGAPRLKDPINQNFALVILGRAYKDCGQPSLAVTCFERAVAISYNLQRDTPYYASLAKDLCLLSDALRISGALRAAEKHAFTSLRLNRDPTTPKALDSAMIEAIGLSCIGRARMTRGAADNNAALQREIRISRDLGDSIAAAYVDLAQAALWHGTASDARSLVQEALNSAKTGRAEKALTRAVRLRGEVALAVSDLAVAAEALHDALVRCRALNDVEEELPSLTLLAALCLRRGDFVRARDYLDSVWESAARGRYPLVHADARNVLAEIEIAENNIPAAIAAATEAYRLAWCDGPPFAYDYGLRTARAHLRVLGAPEPEMPPYDASKHEPIEEVDIGEIGRESEGEQTK